MAKRILCIMLVIISLLSIAPMSVFAEGETIIDEIKSDKSSQDTI